MANIKTKKFFYVILISVKSCTNKKEIIYNHEKHVIKMQCLSIKYATRRK